MSDEGKMVEFILRTAEAEPEESMRALVSEMLEHTAEGDVLPEAGRLPKTPARGGDESPGGNAAVEAIMTMLKENGGDIATLAAPFVGAGLAGKGKRLRGAGIGAGVGLAANAAGAAMGAPGFKLGLGVLDKLSKVLERRSIAADNETMAEETAQHASRR